jgi:hypothetical protein
VASLRKRPSDVVDTTAPAAPAMAASAGAGTTEAPPAPQAGQEAKDEASQALQRQIEALRQAETAQQQTQIAMLGAQDRRNAWVEATPLARQHPHALNTLHHAALQSGLADTSPEYFRFMEGRLAALSQPSGATQIAQEMQQRAGQGRESEPPPAPPRAPMVSAPVSREVPASDGRRLSGKVTLSREEQEAARNSGISLEEYGKQKMRLHAMRAAGEYGGEDRR